MHASLRPTHITGIAPILAGATASLGSMQFAGTVPVSAAEVGNTGTAPLLAGAAASPISAAGVGGGG